MIANKKLSQYRKEIYQLIQNLKKISFRCASSEPLIYGVPGEVFRKCGKPGCKCESYDSRHGPYKVVQIYRNGKQKQIAIGKNQIAIWRRAKLYQQQMKYVTELKNICEQLENTVKRLIKERIEEWPK